MSILDDAIREHLELKRAHGAEEGELQKLEDEAFGPPQRPDEADPFNEAPTEFLLSPSGGAADAPEVGDEAARGGRRPNITDLQEAPAAEGHALFDADEELSRAPDAPPPSPTDAADVPLPPPPDEAPAAEVPADDAPAAQGPPSAEEAPAPPAHGAGAPPRPGGPRGPADRDIRAAAARHPRPRCRGRRPPADRGRIGRI